jgi:hypothetical protein
LKFFKAAEYLKIITENFAGTDPLMHFKDADVDVDVNAGQKLDIRWGSRFADLLS